MKELFWLCLGLTAQILFSARFFFQWVASEMSGKSVIPVSFWYLSISGATLLLFYSIYRKDPVFILGQCFGLFVYIRNLFWILRENKEKRNS